MAHTRLKNILFNKAKEKFGDIVLCPNCRDWDDSYTIASGQLVLWFNDKENSTHVVKRDIKEEK